MKKLARIRNGDNAAYKYIDFKDGAEEITLHVKPLKKGGTINLRLNQPWQPQLLSVNIPGEENADWKTVTQKIETTKGIHAVWLTFYGEEDIVRTRLVSV